MAKYNFETREIAPYNDKLDQGPCGALWYIKEKDGIFLIDNKVVRPNKADNHIEREWPIAQGLPAAMLAQGDLIARSDFDSKDFFYAYFKEMESLFPKKPAFDVYTVIVDWIITLHHITLVDNRKNSPLDQYARMKVGVILRTLFNPYNILDLKDRFLTQNSYACVFFKQREPRLLSARKPNLRDRLAAPVIISSKLGESNDNPKLLVQGFGAAIINLAMYYDGEKRWLSNNFADVETVEKIIKAYETKRHIPKLEDLHNLSFTLPHKLEDLFKAYMEAFEPIMREVWEYKPDVQLACIEGDNVYTYIYTCEISASEDLRKSELYENLDSRQQHDLTSYINRFFEWILKSYPITRSSQKRIMDAIGRDMPPVELTLQTDVHVTHADGSEEPVIHRTKHIPGKPVEHSDFTRSKTKQSPKKGAKFAYIMTDDAKVITQIHKRIEVHVSSPAELRDELERLQAEGLVSLPMDNPTAIIREIHNIWGDKAAKERSFVTTWGRRH